MMECTFHRATLAHLEKLCEERYLHLTIEDGCDCDVAADRTFDALEAALGVHAHCYDPRDRLFENKLREAAGRLENAENQLGKHRG